jgi:hypothetical protein
MKVWVTIIILFVLCAVAINYTPTWILVAFAAFIGWRMIVLDQTPPPK